jgi:hypothetical protein
VTWGRIILVASSLLALLWIGLRLGARQTLSEERLAEKQVATIRDVEKSQALQEVLGQLQRCMHLRDEACVCRLHGEVDSLMIDAGDWWLLRGQCLLREGKPELALQAFEAAQARGSVREQGVLHGLRERATKLAQENSRLGMLYSAHFELQVEEKTFDQASRLLQALEEAYDSLCMVWSYYPRGPIRAVLYSDRIFQGSDSLPDWVGAVFNGKVRIPANIMQDWPRHRRVIAHEVAHAFHYEMAGQRALPTWLDEGLAQDFDGTKLDVEWLSSQPVPSEEALQGSFMIVNDALAARGLYQHSLKRVRELLQEVGRDSVKSMLLRAAGVAEKTP